MKNCPLEVIWLLHIHNTRPVNIKSVTKTVMWGVKDSSAEEIKAVDEE